MVSNMYLVKQKFMQRSPNSDPLINYQYLFYDDMGDVQDALSNRFIEPNSEVFVLEDGGSKIWLGTVGTICNEQDGISRMSPEVKPRVTTMDDVLDQFNAGLIDKEEMGRLLRTIHKYNIVKTP